MKAVVCHEAQLAVADREPPVPERGQLLLEVLRCGICGSDLHARHHCDELAAVTAQAGYADLMRSDQEIVLGHEFCGAVAEHGPKTRTKLTSGTPVVALPMLRRGGAVHGVGLSRHAPGAYAEQMVVEASMTLPVPNGLAPEIAVLTEPMAVGLHAVNRSEIRKRQVAVVVGCGPVGLAVILLLKARGVRTVVASDFSPGRRALATACGADAVVDPAQGSPFEAIGGHGHVDTLPEALELAVGGVEKLSRLPFPWWQAWRAAEAVGAASPKHPVIFECVGVPGVIDQIIAAAPLFSRVVVVGVCMGEDRIRPAMAINKEIDLRFVVVYTPLEFRQALRMLAEGDVDPRPLITGTVGLAGVEAAFDALGDPEVHAKILIDPRSDASTPVPAPSVRQSPA